jgi:hypothetical protein
MKHSETDCRLRDGGGDHALPFAKQVSHQNRPPDRHHRRFRTDAPHKNYAVGFRIALIRPVRELPQIGLEPTAKLRWAKTGLKKQLGFPPLHPRAKLEDELWGNRSVADESIWSKSADGDFWAPGHESERRGYLSDLDMKSDKRQWVSE